MFYLLILKRGDNWKIVQKVHDRHLYDIPVSKVDDIDETTVDDNDYDDEILPPLQPTTTLVKPSSLVRHDIAPIHFPYQLFVELNISGPNLPRNDTSFEEDDDDDDDKDEEDGVEEGQGMVIQTVMGMRMQIMFIRMTTIFRSLCEISLVEL